MLKNIGDNMTKKSRWLKFSTSSNKQLAIQKAYFYLKKNPKRTGFKLKKRGNYYDVYLYTSEKSLF